MTLYQLCFYVPGSHLQPVKDALFAQGAGKIGDYDCCAWQTEGSGQFRARPGSNPFVGQLDTVETVHEYKVEMVCSAEHIKAVLTELIATHPYETPAYSVSEIMTLADFNEHYPNINLRDT